MKHVKLIIFILIAFVVGGLVSGVNVSVAKELYNEDMLVRMTSRDPLGVYI